MADKPPIRFRLANFLLGSRKKEFVQPLSPLDGWSLDGTGRLNSYTTRPEQLAANLGWVFAANTAIVEPAASVQFKLYRKKKDGDREEIMDHPILDLLDNPNAIHTGEQLRQLHYTYMNLTGESYILMLSGSGNGLFKPKRGQLPDALQILPTHRVVFKLGKTRYSESTVKINQEVYPIESVIRDINPDPGDPNSGRSIIAASASVIDLENQMVGFNQHVFANDARPGMVFKSAQQLSDTAYQRWKQQFSDDHTGVENAGKPLLIEGGDVTPLMINQKDLEYLGGREFSMKQILSMFKVSPGMLGQVENVNRSNLEAGFYIHSVINTVPRVRQFVKQLNVSFVQVFDPTLELDYENPVPEDVAAKLEATKAGVGSWLTTDEGRDTYGMKPLPNGLGDHIVYVAGKTPATLDSVVAAEKAAAEAATQNPEDPDDNNDDDLDEDPSNDDPEAEKSLSGVKKKT